MESPASVMRTDPVSLVEALATRFPVTRALAEDVAGDDVFRAMARAFLESLPPSSPGVMTCGDGFGDFMDAFPLTRPAPYLGDMARLEAAWARAHHAADAVPLTVGELAAFAPHAWEQTRTLLHPSVQVVRSAYPVVTMWEARLAGPPRVVRSSAAEDALVARPDRDSQVHRLPPGGAIFIRLLMSRATFGEAADQAGRGDRRFDFVTSLSVLLGHRLIVGLEPMC